MATTNIDTTHVVKNSSYDVRPDILVTSSVSDLEPEDGKIIFDDTINALKVYNGLEWVKFSSNAIISEPVFYAVSPLATQEPTTVDVPIQLSIGAAQTTPFVNITSLGAITFNQIGTYIIRVKLNLGRTGSGSASLIHFRQLINGVQPVNTTTTSAGIDNYQTHMAFETTQIITNQNLSNILTFEIMRDSSGYDSGGLFETPVTASGWNVSPCISMNINRLILDK